MRKKRIAYGRINQETHAFSPVETTLQHFEEKLWMEGQALEEACRWRGNEAPGWTPAAELSGFASVARKHREEVELVPLLSAWALPSGPMTEDTYFALRARLVEALRQAGPLDGVFFVLHGAMRAKSARCDHVSLDALKAPTLAIQSQRVTKSATRAWPSGRKGRPPMQPKVWV